MRGEVSEAANIDLDGIYDYGAERFGEAAADAYLRHFESAHDLLAKHPQIWVGASGRATANSQLRLRMTLDLLRFARDWVTFRRVLHQTMDVDIGQRLVQC